MQIITLKARPTLSGCQNIVIYNITIVIYNRLTTFILFGLEETNAKMGRTCQLFEEIRLKPRTFLLKATERYIKPFHQSDGLNFRHSGHISYFVSDRSNSTWSPAIVLNYLTSGRPIRSFLFHRKSHFQSDQSMSMRGRLGHAQGLELRNWEHSPLTWFIPMFNNYSVKIKTENLEGSRLKKILTTAQSKVQPVTLTKGVVISLATVLTNEPPCCQKRF